MTDPSYEPGAARVPLPSQSPGMPHGMHPAAVDATYNGGRHWATPKPQHRAHKPPWRRFTPAWILPVWILVVLALLAGVAGLAWR